MGAYNPENGGGQIVSISLCLYLRRGRIADNRLPLSAIGAPSAAHTRILDHMNVAIIPHYEDLKARYPPSGQLSRPIHHLNNRGIRTYTRCSYARETDGGRD